MSICPLNVLTVRLSPFVSAVARGRLLGVQFHPERSGADGLRLLANVVATVSGAHRRLAAGRDAA